MAFNITAIMNVALASGAATKISRDINKALQNKRVTVDLSLANPDSIKRIKADIEGAITSVESFGRQAGLAAKRFGAFSLAAGSMITLVSAIKSSTAEAISFDREMVRLGQVSNDSVASIQAVGNEVTRLSVALGVSSKDLIGAAVTLKQANLSIDDTKIALEALAKAALAPNFENFANTTQGAIAVLNQFKIGAAGLEAALGSVNAVAGEYAVEASDLVEVIRKTGGAFKSAGGDLNELLALFTSVRQTTRESAETISTGLRTIFTRIQRGQTIESLKELGINLRYTSQEATALGNTKLADQFVGPYEAVRRLSEALAGIPTTSGKYSAIVEELGGYRQISKVIPLLQEFSVSQGALNVALGGSSSLAANAAQAQNAYIIKIQKIKEEFNALIRSVTQSSGFQKIFDTFISGASAAIQLADALKFLLPLITAIAAVKLATSFGQFVKGFATGVTASPNPKIFNQNRVAEGGYIKMAKGGVVPGSGSGDKVKALLEPGEVVIPKKYAGGGTISVNEMSSLAIQRKLNDPLIKEEDYKTGKTINKNDNFKYEIVTIKVDGGKESLKGDYKQQGDSFEKEAEKQLGAIRIAKSDDRGSNSPVDLEKNGFPYEIKNVSSPVSDASIVDKLARYRFQKFGDNIFKNSSKGEETIDLGQIGLVYNTAKITGNDAFKDTETITAGQENYRRKTYATQTSEGISNVTLSTQEAKNRLATKKASGGFMIPGTGNTDSVPMDLDEGSFVVRKSSVAKLGAENLSNISRKGYADGGKVPAMLMPGEFVFSPSSAKSIGSANLERMNKHAKFAAGGRVGLAEGGNPNPIGEEAYTVASQTKIKIPNFQSLEQFVKGFPDLTKAQESLEKIILEEVRAFNANLSEEQKLTEATKIASDVMRKYDDLDRAIEAQKQAMTSRGSARPLADIEADQAELAMLEGRKKRLSEKVGLSSTVLPTGDTEFRTKIGTDQKIETGKGKDYEYKVNEKVNISDEIRNRARDRAVKISPSGDGENIASVTKIRLALEEEGKLRNQAIEAIGQQLRITTGITDKQVLLEMATEKFAIAMQQNAKLAKDGQGRLLGLQSLEQDILDSGKDADKSMRGVSIELKQGSTAFGKLKLIFRNMGDAIEGATREIVDEFRKGGGGIRGTFAAIKNSKPLKIAAGVATAAVGIVGQGLASTAGTAEDVSKGAVSESRYVNSTGIGEALNQGATAAIALSMIPVAGPFLAVIGGATAALFGFLGAVKKAQIELMKVQVDKKAKDSSEKISELKNFSGVEREQKGLAAFTDVRSTVFAIRQTATAEGLSGAKLEDEVRAKSLEKFGSNLGAISEELSNAIANMVKPDDKRKSEDIYNEFKQTSYGQLAIESLGVASGKSTVEVQKHALALASSAVTAKKLEDAQKNSMVIHEKMNLRMSVLTNSINLASESFRNISESMVNFSDILEGRSEFKIQQNASKLKIGTDEKIFNKETDRAFLPFGKEGDNLKNQAKELNAFALNLPAAFDTAKETVRNNKTGDIGVTTEEILKKQLGMKQEDKFSSTQQELIELFKGQIQNEQKNKPDLGGISGEKITKDALGQAISQMEQLLQSNMQAVSQVSQSYISGLRRISDEQKKYIQELDKVADKTLSVNKAQANIDAAKVRGNPEDFLTREQRIAPFVQKQINVTQGAVNRGAIQAKDIQDPQAIFKAITDAQAALIDSDKKLQEENAKLASANKGDAEAARKAALENNNIRDNISTLGEALRNLRDDTVMLAEAESRLTQAEKDRENKLSVTENLLTMDKAGKRSLQRGKDAAEQVAGGANLEDMSTKQKKAFFEYTKLYANIKVPGLGGKTGEQVRQAGLERAAGGLGLGVGKENEAANKAREDILKIEKTREEAAQKYADLLKGNDQANVDALKKVGDNFITELQNMLARENDRNLKGQIAVEDVKMDKLTQIKNDKNYQQYTNIIGQGPNKNYREKQFSTVFDSKNLKNIADKKKEIEIVQSRMDAVDRYTKDEGSRVNLKQADFDKKIVLNKELSAMKGPFTDEDLKSYLPSVVASPFQLHQGAKDTPAGEFATKTPDLLLIAERMRGVSTSIEKLPKAIDDLALIIKDMKDRLINPPPAVPKANGGFIGRSMGGSIYNNPTKDIAQRDKYPTLLSKGEFVMNEGAARNNRPELEAMNKGHKVNYFAEGTPETAEQMKTRLFKNRYGFDPSLTKEGREKISKDNAPKKAENDKWLKEFYEKYNDTPITIPKDFEFKGANRDRQSIHDELGRKDILEYNVRDIRNEFEKSVSDLAYVNVESKKVKEDEGLPEELITLLGYGIDSKINIGSKASSIKEIKENEKTFDYKNRFFGEMKRYGNRYGASYGDRIDPSISNNIRSRDGQGLRDVWNEVASSYGKLPNPFDVTPNTKIQSVEQTENDIAIQELNEKFERYNNSEYINIPSHVYLKGSYSRGDVRNKENDKRSKKKGGLEGRSIGTARIPIYRNEPEKTYKNPDYKIPVRKPSFKLNELSNQEESNVYFDLIKQAREEKDRVLNSSIQEMRDRVRKEIDRESSTTIAIPLKGQDATSAKLQANLQARIKNGILPSDKLPFPTRPSRRLDKDGTTSPSEEFTPEAEAAPVTRPTIAMQEAQVEKIRVFNAGAGEREKNRQFQADNLTLIMRKEAERHGDFSREASSLYKQENESFVGPLEDPQDKIKKMMAFKKNQIQSGDTNSLAQRLHTQIAKTIASHEEPKMDFNHPEVYGRYLSQPEIFKQIDKDGIIKNVPSTTLQADSRKALKVYADKNIPVLNPAIMALQEYYDSVDQRRFGFDQTEDFARTIQNKNIELAAKMDREAAMLLARKVRGEVKKEFPEIYTEPSKDMNRLMKLYKTYNQAVGIKWQGADDNLIYAGDPPNKRMIDESMGKHDYQSKNKDYHNIYDQIDIIANDMNYIGENYLNEFSIPVYEKVKRDQAVLESFIKDKIQKAPQGSRNIAIQDFLERQKKEKPAEAAKVIAEEQAKPVVAAPVGQAKPNPAVVAVEQAKPPMSGDRQNAPEDQIAKQDDAKRRMLTSYVSLVQDNPLYWEGTKDEENANKKYHDIFSRFREGTPDSFKYYIARQPNQKGKKPEMDDMIKPIDQSSRNIKALSRLGQGGVFSATGDLTNEFMKSNTESKKEKIKKEEEIVRSMGGEKDDVFFEQFARNTLSVANNLTKVPVVPLFNTGGPVAYRSVGGSIDTMLTPKEKVFSPRKVAQIESKSPGLLSHVNSGGKVKHLSLGGQASFTVPDHAPNPKGIPSANTDTVYARLETGSFVVNAKSSIENASLLQHLASGGSVGYYADGGKLQKSDFNLLGYPTDENLDFSTARTALMKRVYGNAELKATLKEYAGGKSQGLEDLLQEIVSEHFHKNKIGRIGGVRNKQTALYDAIMPGFNNIHPENFKSFLSGNALENTDKQYRDLVNKKADKELQNLPALNDELNSPFKRGSISSKNPTINLPNNKISKKGPTEEELIRMERNIRNAKTILPELENSKKGPNQEDLLVMDQNVTETKNFQAGRNETSKKGPTEEELVRMERNAKEQKQLKEESNRTYKVGPTERESITMQQNAEKNKQIQRLKSPEMQEKERLNKITEFKNINARKIELENLKKKLEESKKPFGDLKEYRRISEEIDVKNKEYDDLIEKSRINKNDFNFLPQAPGFADGGAVGYYGDGGRVNRIANKLDTKKRKSEKQHGSNYDAFERHMENKKQKILNFNDMPKLLKGNKEIDKTYLTKMKHFEPNYIEGLDPKIAKNFMNQLNSKNIKGVAGPNADFNNANYFGEIGKIFNLTDTFLRNQDVTALHESLDLKTKNRVDLEQGVSGEIIAINKPLEQARNLKKQNGGLFPRLKAFEFMKAYGAVDEDGKPIHTAITARAEYFNPNAGVEDFLNLRFKSENPAQDDFEIEKLIKKPRRFDQGGYVNGASDGDSVNAKLRPGEFVLTPRTAQKLGYERLKKANQGFYNGGEVGSPRASVFDKMNNVANSQSANSMDVDSLNNAAREFNKAAKSFETSMAKMEKSVNKLEGTMDKLSKVNIPDNITGTIKVDNKIDLDITSSNFAMDMTTAVGKAVSDITGRLKDATDGKIDIA